MKRWQFSFLIFELVLFAAILVLPQVALPDFTFHDGTVLRWRLTRESVIRLLGTAIAVAPQILPPELIARIGGEIPSGSTLRRRFIPGFPGCAF